MTNRRRSIDGSGRRVHDTGRAWWLLGTLLLTASCAVPDSPRTLPEALAEPVLSHLRPDTVRASRIAPGVVYRYVWSGSGPWAIHMIQVDLDRCELSLDVLQAEDREAGGSGHERVSSMASRRGESVIAAVNADFFTPEGAATGTEILDGDVRTVRPRPALAWTDAERGLWMGVPEIDDDSVSFGWKVSRGAGDASTDALGGFPELLDAGERVGDLGVEARPGFAAERHPRTAVGYDAVRNEAWIVVVDGRQLPHSAGMSLPEVVELFEVLGIRDAINLDGGGSTVMVVEGRPVSRPSDLTGERPVVNALALVRDPVACGS